MREEAVFVTLYREPNPDQPPFPPLARQLAEQRQAGKSQITVHHVGNKEDLDEEGLQLDGSMVFVTRHDSPAPVEKPAQAAQDQHQEDLDDPPVIPEAPRAPAPAREPAQEPDPLKPKRPLTMWDFFDCKTGW